MNIMSKKSCLLYILVAVVITISLIGFQKTKTVIPSSLLSQSQVPTISKKECEEKDGKWMRPRYGGESFCNLPDAGEQCTNGSECSSGLCLSDSDTKALACTKYWLEY